MQSIDIKTVVHVAVEGLLIGALFWWVTRQNSILLERIEELEKKLLSHDQAIRAIIHHTGLGQSPRKNGKHQRAKNLRSNQQEDEDEEEEEQEQEPEEEEDDELKRELDTIDGERRSEGGRRSKDEKKD
jgi:hypothetical protein